MRGQTHLQFATEQSKLYGVGNLDAVAQKARELQVGGHLIITAGDAKYKGVILNFLAHLYALGLKNTLIMSFDDELLPVVGHHGVRVSIPKDGSIPGCSTFRASGSLRVLPTAVTKHAGVLVSLIEAANAAHGPPFSVTWMDADCLFTGAVSYFDWLAANMGGSADAVDVIAQRGRHPYPLYRKIGSTICVGLMTIAPTAKALDFYTDYYASWSKRRGCDDQILFNEVAKAHGAFAPWIRSVEKKMVYGSLDDGEKMSIGPPPLKVNGTRAMRLGLLPYSRFPRGVAHSHRIGALSEWDAMLCSAHPPLAWHQQMWKDGQKKVTVMKRDGVFALNDGWESGAVDLGTAQTFFNRTVKTCPGTSMTASQIAAAARAAMKG